MFIAGAVCSVIGAAFPPVLVSLVILGLFSLVWCAVQALREREKHVALLQQPEGEGLAYHQLMRLIMDYKKKRMQNMPSDPDEEKEAVVKSMYLDAMPQHRFQEVLEMIRSFGSGLSKGRVVDLPLSGMMDLDHGHYEETPIMVVLGMLMSVFYGLVYLVRSFAKNWRGANDVPLPTRESLIPKRSHHSAYSFWDKGPRGRENSDVWCDQGSGLVA